MAVNHLIFQGRMTKDLEMRITTSDVEVVSFTLAWNEKVKEIDRKCFQKCKAWRGTARFLNTWFHDKGSEVVVEGHLETEEWDDKDGNHRQENVLTVDKAHFVGSTGKKKSDAPAASNAGVTGGTFTPAGDDDSLPF